MNSGKWIKNMSRIALVLMIAMGVYRCAFADEPGNVERHKIRYNESESPAYDAEMNLIAVVYDYGEPTGNHRKYSVRYEIPDSLVAKIRNLSGVVGAWSGDKYDIFVEKGSAFQWWEIEPFILEALKPDISE